MTERPSVTSFVMEARLPWLDDVPAAGIDGPFDAGMIHEAGQQRSCTIRKISALGATLRSDVLGAPGDEIALELATGQRPAATIEWVSGGEAGIRFKQPVDMLALINRNLISQPTERRAMPRVELRCGLHVKWGANLAPATLRNISAQGLQIEGEALPPRGTFVSLFTDGLIVPSGEVVWRKGELAGIELLEELSWTSIIPWIREVGRNPAR
jgi:PilZ domain